MDLIKRFEQKETWDVDPTVNPHWMKKTELIRAFIPPDVKSILDVGCGNGALTHYLAYTYTVFGLDASQTALAQVKVPAAVTWADHLPVADQAVDLVLCSEVLEHLPTPTLWLAVLELQRVARCWLLITVPFNEQLALRNVWCDCCQRPFHVYGHVQRFTLQRLRQLFAGWQLSAWVHCGNQEIPYHPWLLFISQYIGRQWYSDVSTYRICPRCHATTFRSHEGNRVAYWCDRLNKRFYGNGRICYPYWVVTLWQRT